MLKTFCDRCGKEIKRPVSQGSCIKVYHVVFEYGVIREEPAPKKINVDLCDVCSTDLLYWLKQKEVNHA